ncbi:MAG: hypothetical protein M3O70_14135 [Actinomycetota bacterium]|nr:hypothetical protein [Actinomycetota bacterium]
MKKALAIDASALTAGTILTGLAAYAYIVVGTRSLGAAAFAPISILWTFWTVAAAVLGFPLEHWVIRTARADGNEERIRRVAPQLVGVLAILACGAGAGSWLLREGLFAQRSAVFPAFVALVTAGSGLTALLRGSLAARDRFVSAGLAIAGENLVRLALAVAMAAADRGVTAFATALVCGPLVAAAWPDAFRYRRGPLRDTQSSMWGFFGGIASGSLTAQVVLTGGPVALALLGGAPDDVTALFAALALFRAPYQIALGLGARLTGVLTGFVVEGASHALLRVRTVTSVGTLVAGVAAGGFGALIGPLLVPAVFGPDVRLAPWLLAVVAAGSTVALGTLVLTLLLVAQDRAAAVLTAWLVSLAAGIAWILAAPGPALERVTVAFGLAELLAFAAMLAIERRVPVGPRVRSAGERRQGTA